MSSIWDVLRIEETTDKRVIKKAYAARSREVHPEEKPQEFQALHQAYQTALRYASSKEGGKAQTAGEAGKEGKPVLEEEREKEARLVAELGKESKPVLEEEYEKEGQSETEPGKEEKPVSEAEQENGDRSVQKAGTENGDRQVPEERNIYSMTDGELEEVKKQWTGMEEIRYFQSYFGRQISLWMQGREFLDEMWVKYLQSQRFQQIMWNPIVMETISSGAAKHFQSEQRIKLFFWKLYNLDACGVRGEDDFADGSRQTLYRSLCPVEGEGSLRQKIEDIDVFLERWRTQMAAWRNGEGFRKEWLEYMKSESFAGVMWTNTVLETIATGMKSNFPCHGEAALFLWDLYGPEKLRAENCKGKGVELYRILYPLCIYRSGFPKHERNKDNNAKRENRRIYKILLIGACILVLFGVVLYVNSFMSAVGSLCCIAIVYLLFFAIVKWVSSR